MTDQVSAWTVKKGLGANRWLVEDATGAQMQVYSAETWPPGTPVLVSGGVIIGRAGRARAVQIFEV